VTRSSIFFILTKHNRYAPAHVSRIIGRCQYSPSCSSSSTRCQLIGDAATSTDATLKLYARCSKEYLLPSYIPAFTTGCRLICQWQYYCRIRQRKRRYSVAPGRIQSYVTGMKGGHLVEWTLDSFKFASMARGEWQFQVMPQKLS
jgi:hypothetical protein